MFNNAAAGLLGIALGHKLISFSSGCFFLNVSFKIIYICFLLMHVYL